MLRPICSTPPTSSTQNTNDSPTSSAETKTLTPEEHFTQGMEGLNNKSRNKSDAIAHIKTAATAGYIPAQLKLGKLYLKGISIKKDYEEASNWFKQVANQEGINTNFCKEISTAQYMIAEMQFLGDDKSYIEAYNAFLTLSTAEEKSIQAKAFYKLGLMYKSGLGESKTKTGIKTMAQTLNPDLAGSYFEEASALNHANATYELALIYQAGNTFFPQNTQQANALFKKAADLGHSEAALEFATNTEDLKTAIHYYSIAAKKTNKMAILRLAKVGEALSKSENPEELQLAFHCLDTTAQLDHSGAQRLLGDMHRQGIATPISITTAAQCYINAAKHKNANSIPGLLLVADAFETEQQNSNAFKCLKSAADLGNSNAQFRVGIRYIEGNGITANRRMGIDYLEKSSEQGYPMATYHLGLQISGSKGLSLIRQASEKECDLAILYMGNYHRQEHASLMGNDDDFKKAIDCYKKVAKTQPAAYKALAEMTRDGGGFLSAHKPNVNEAKKYFDLAAKHGGMEREAAGKAILAVDGSFHTPILKTPNPINLDNNL